MEAVKRAYSVLVALSLGSAFGQAPPSEEWQTQPVQLEAPQRGSLVGQYASVAWNAMELAKGAHGLGSPFSAPGERGPLMAPVFPTYSAEHGTSEWGVGWQNNLSLSRFRAMGDIEFNGADDFSSPWGRLVKSSVDAYYYPAGLQEKVRVGVVGNSMVAYLPDGSRWLFQELVGPSQRVYAYYLTKIESATGHWTQLTYQSRTTWDRPLLEKVEYGGHGADFQYQLLFDYQTLPIPFFDYRGGERMVLNKRVSAVTVKTKIGTAFVERWSYGLAYEQSTLGPAFYLKDVTQTYKPSQETAPTVRYTYANFETFVGQSRFRPAHKLDQAISALGGEVFLPNKSSVLDINADGMPDLEHARTLNLLRQTPTGYVVEPLEAEANPAEECRRSNSGRDPRTLARMVPGEDTYYVLAVVPFGLSQSDVSICTREGRRLARQRLGVQMELGHTTEAGRTTRLVDLNRDGRPDLLLVTAGQYSYAENISSSRDDLRFAPAQTRALQPTTGTTPINPEALWVYDINGDGLADIVVREADALYVWYGKGRFGFEARAAQFRFYNTRGGIVSDLSSYALTFVEANKDGLADLLLTASDQAQLFINTGSSFHERAVPNLSQRTVNTVPVALDVEGTGNAEVVISRRGGTNVESFALSEAQTGLLIRADDGKGTTLSFDYQRSPAIEGIYNRHSILSSLTVASSGHEPVTYRYNYETPVIHSAAKFLIGFNSVVRTSAQRTEGAAFFNDETYAGLLLSSFQTDAQTNVTAYQTRQYQDVLAAVSSFGLSWKRLLSAARGFRTATENLEERTNYTDYEAEVCPKVTSLTTSSGTLVTEKRRATIPALANHLHCLEDRIILTGTHADPTLDFRHEALLGRNSVGLMESLQNVGSAGPQTMQQIAYNSMNYTVERIVNAGRGTTSFVYEPNTLLLQQVSAPDTQIARVKCDGGQCERNPLTDAILTLEHVRGGQSYESKFRYDGQERLSKQWDNMGGASEASPNQSLSYQYATDTKPGAVSLSTLVEFQPRSPQPVPVFQRAVEWMTAAGEPFTAARRIPEGWAFDALTERKPGTGETNTFLRPTVDGAIDVLSLGYAELFSGATRIGSARATALGHEAESRMKFHVDVEKQIQTTLVLHGGTLLQTATENGVYATARQLDSGKRVLSFEDEAHTRYGYVYDALGRLRSVQLPDGTVHQVGYDDYGRVAFVYREGVAYIDYAYDGMGRLTRKRFFAPTGAPNRAAIREVAIEYDSIGRKRSETYTDVSASPPAQTYEYFYDGATPATPEAHTDVGMLSAVRGDGFVKVLEYRPDGLIQTETVTITGWRSLTTQYAYFEDKTIKSKRSTVTDVTVMPPRELSSSEKSYAHDSYGRVSEMRLNGQVLGVFGFNGDGLLNYSNFASRGELYFDYDNFTRRMTGFRQSVGPHSASSSQRMNNRGLVAREGLKVDGDDLTRTYGYSPSGFLVSSSDSPAESLVATSYEYGFGPFGLPNRIRDAQGDRNLNRTGDTLTAGGVNYHFDALGRIDSKSDGLTLHYGANGHIASAERGGVEYSFLYDEQGHRLAKFAGASPVAGYFGDNYLDSASFVEPIKITGKLTGVIQNGVFRQLASDMRGTVIANEDWSTRFASPFGDRTVPVDLGRALDYVGKHYDSDLGFFTHGVRDNDPKINSFVSPDPLFLERPDACLKSPVECNLYSYAGNDPILYVDPTGYAEESPGNVRVSASSPIVGVFGAKAEVTAKSSDDWSLRVGVGVVTKPSYDLGLTHKEPDRSDIMVCIEAKYELEALNVKLAGASGNVEMGIREMTPKVEAAFQFGPLNSRFEGKTNEVDVQIDVSWADSLLRGPGEGGHGSGELGVGAWSATATVDFVLNSRDIPSTNIPNSRVATESDMRQVNNISGGMGGWIFGGGM